MKIYHDIESFVAVKNAIVTVGTFDGVHLGHQAIFRKMIQDAKEIGGQTVVITFHPHPRLVLNIDSSSLRFITTQEKKLQILEKTGIDHVIIIRFTKEFSRTNSETFIREYIVEKIKPARLVIGYDHHFGKNRMGDFKLLYDLSQKYHFKVERIAAQDVENIAISSTKIRKALEAGDVKKANRLLGYEYTICGTVVHGNARGRDMGFPTANIETDPQFKLITFCGVYACHVEHKGKRYAGMGNIGYRPTIGNDDLTIEVNIFDFNETIYGDEICISFMERIRDEEKFDSIESLKQRLIIDREEAKKLLGI
ncbi:MAG: bifunctional riboflavin kinase/FAD synthetase [Bacteroidales bacterium]|nr:bifunctional riboflavin kinase/FAD synthetase [Bacteroidales bacterium]